MCIEALESCLKLFGEFVFVVVYFGSLLFKDFINSSSRLVNLIFLSLYRK